MRAVVYESNTGHTKRYAEMLAQKLGVECVPLKEAVKTVPKGESVFFLGWVFANQVRGFKKASRRWDVKALGAVGLYPKSETNIDILVKKNSPSCPLFYMQGGIDFGKLKGMQKKLLELVRDGVARENNPENDAFVDILTNGGDFVSEENLSELIVYGLMQ